MNKQESTILQKVTLELAEIKMVLVGNRELNTKGLVHAQDGDEKWKVRSDEKFSLISSSLEEIKRNQEHAKQAHEDLNHRLTRIEEPLKVLNVVLNVGRKVKTKSVIIWALVGSGLTGIAKAWDSIISFFQQSQ